jgi:hypothetical protein
MNQSPTYCCGENLGDESGPLLGKIVRTIRSSLPALDTEIKSVELECLGVLAVFKFGPVGGRWYEQNK